MDPLLVSNLNYMGMIAYMNVSSPKSDLTRKRQVTDTCGDLSSKTHPVFGIWTSLEGPTLEVKPKEGPHKTGH